MIISLISFVIGGVMGVLFGRKNKKVVENSLTAATAQVAILKARVNALIQK